MKFSENWLRSLVDIAADRDALVHRLTMSGLEVEGVDAYELFAPVEDGNARQTFYPNELFTVAAIGDGVMLARKK